MRIGIVRESDMEERRVAMVPETVARLVKSSWEVWVESGAGDRACYADSAYTEAGAHVEGDRRRLWQECDIIVKVAPPQMEEVELYRSGQIAIGLHAPLNGGAAIPELARRGVTTCALELIPRSTRAQSMDVLSSQGSIVGYKAVIMAANALPQYFPMLTTAAGTIRPAKILIIGAGVAGLQAIATARRLGAIVSAFDVRSAVKEEVRSLGAQFIEMPDVADASDSSGYAKQTSEDTTTLIREHLAASVIAANVVITTAQIPGKRAPILIDSETIAQMTPGSIVIDLAAATGGNCPLTAPGRDVVYRGVTIFGPLDLANTVPVHASQLYSKNVANLLEYLGKDGNISANFEDEIFRSICITNNGEITNDRVRQSQLVSAN